MSLTKRYGQQPVTSNSRQFTCPKYDPVPGSKRCKDYLDNGGCRRPDEFMCVEWLKANHPAVGPNEQQAPVSEVAEPTLGEADTEPPAAAAEDTEPPLPGRLTPPQPVFSLSSPSSPPQAVTRDPGPPPPRQPPRLTAADSEPTGAVRESIPPEDLASFKALGVELCLQSEELEVWLVPEYTERDRKELSIEHAATLRLLVDAFPGSKIIAFDRTEQA